MSLIKLSASLIGIRTHDNIRGIWFNTYPELEQATVQAGKGSLSMHFGLQNYEVADIYRRGVLYRDDTTVLFDYIATIPSGEFHNFEITTDMPNKATKFTFTWLKGMALGRSSDSLAVWTVEGSYSFIVQSYNPNPPPDGNGYNTKETCEAAGYFWYDNACHLNPKPTDEKETWFDKHKTEVAIGGVTVFAAIVLAVLVGKK